MVRIMADMIYVTRYTKEQIFSINTKNIQKSNGEKQGGVAGIISPDKGGV